MDASRRRPAALPLRRCCRSFGTAVEALAGLITTPAAMREQARQWKVAGLSTGLVPTMGALHAGHLSLVARCRGENDRTVVSVFVNPLQFGPGEDFEAYPRDPETDLGLLRAQGADSVYMPSLDAMYPTGATTRVGVRGLDEPLEGVHRPGHFEGVATVVTKLFNTVAPERAYFGQKDAQQAAVVTRLAADLDTGVRIVVCPIVREPDGLALSSRNVYLSAEERRAATILFQALRSANGAYRGGCREPSQLREVLQAVLAQEPLARPDYAEVVDPATFLAPDPGAPAGGPLLAVLAVRFGRTRLIDNHRLGDPV